MSRIMQFRSTWNQLKQLDLRAGRLAGNSGHMRKDGGDPVDYALALAGRTLVAGFAFALVQLLGAIVFIVYPPYGIYVGLCEGLVLFVLAGYLYPGKWEFMLGIILGLFPASIATTDAIFKGIPVLDALSLSLVLELTQFGLVTLTAACGVGWLVPALGRELNRRFPEKPKPAPRPGSLAYYIANKQLTPEEDTARLIWYLVFGVCVLAGLITMIVGGFGIFIWGMPSLGLVMIGILVVTLSGYVVGKRLFALRERVRARLEPAPEPQLDRVFL